MLRSLGEHKPLRQGEVVACRSFWQLALRLKNVAPRHLGIGQIGPERQRSPETRGGLIRFALSFKNRSQVHAGFGEVWVAIQGSTVSSRGFDQLSLGLEDNAKVGMIASLPGVDGNGGANELDGDIHAANIVGQHSEHVQAACMARIDGQDAAVDALRIRQAALAMVLDGVGQHSIKNGDGNGVGRLPRGRSLRRGNGIDGLLHWPSVGASRR